MKRLFIMVLAGLLVFSIMANALPTSNSSGNNKPNASYDKKAPANAPSNSTAETSVPPDDGNGDVAVTPEPGTLVLIAIGLVGLAIVLRKKKAAVN